MGNDKPLYVELEKVLNILYGIKSTEPERTDTDVRIDMAIDDINNLPSFTKRE